MKCGGDLKLPNSWIVRNNVHWSDYTASDVYGCVGTGEGFCEANGTESNNLDRNDMATTPYADATPDIDIPSNWYLEGPSAGVAIDAGLNLGSTVFYDAVYRSRPLGGDYDIGANEVVNSTNTGVLAWHPFHPSTLLPHKGLLP
jgi:hypothetical protein